MRLLAHPPPPLGAGAACRITCEPQPSPRQIDRSFGAPTTKKRLHGAKGDTCDKPLLASFSLRGGGWGAGGVVDNNANDGAHL